MLKVLHKCKTNIKYNRERKKYLIVIVSFLDTFIRTVNTYFSFSKFLTRMAKCTKEIDITTTRRLGHSHEIKLLI